MRMLFKIMIKTVKWFFIVFFVWVISLCFRATPLPANLLTEGLDYLTPSNIVFYLGSATYGFRHGLTLRDFKLYNLAKSDPITPVAAFESLTYQPFNRRLVISGLKYPRLPDSYYAPENQERNERLEVKLPSLNPIALTLIRPEILGVAPEGVVGDLAIASNRLTLSRFRLNWPDQDAKMQVDGFCYVDIPKQEVYGEVEGEARQPNVRPLMLDLDIPSAMPYFDGFTEVPGVVPAFCSWKVNLINNDCDIRLKLKPPMGRYNSVPMKLATGDIHLHIYTRGTNLNYRQVFGPIHGENADGRTVDGTVWVSGTNRYNTVDVDARSTMAIAELLKIGGFTDDYVDEDILGESRCRLQFRFPRAMTNNYEVLDGYGHFEVKNGRIMRMRGFQGMIALLAEKVPGVAWFTDATQASGDYVIEKGVLKTDNIYIEGTFFSIKIYGELNLMTGKLDFTVRVQFAKRESLVGAVLHPLTWPFTKLLLEFQLQGTTKNPEWKYISVVDRVLDQI